MRRVVIVFLALPLLVGLSLAYVYWPNLVEGFAKAGVDVTQDRKDIERTKELLNNSKPEEALTIIQQHAESLDNTSENGREWIDLLIRASESTLDTPQLVILHEYHPKAFAGHEKAALLVAKSYLADGRTNDYQMIRGNWKGRETLPETWFVLDADKLLVEGKRKEAIEYLNSHTFQGKADTIRLIRLSLLYVFDDPKVSWNYLAQAYTKDPENPEIRSYRAKLLETNGKSNLAAGEYVAATQTDPSNLYLKDQLAEFYLRNKQIPQALQVWGENLHDPTLDFIWLKALFWNRVAVPLVFDWQSSRPPEGKLEPLIKYLISLRAGEFWNDTSFNALPNAQSYLKTQQATFWLRLLAKLKLGNDKEAYGLLQYNPFQTVSMAPSLEQALKQILHYRATGQLPLSTSNTISKDTPLFFAQLESLAQSQEEVPHDLQDLINGPEAFAAAFLVAGWAEAALNLHTLAVIPQGYPDWYAYELTQALQKNRSVTAAIEFAKLQNSSPSLSLLTGELLISNNQPAAAIKHLRQLIESEGEMGKRAALLVSLVYIEQGDYEEARAAIQSQPALNQDLSGQETLARIALLEGNFELATTLYRKIVDQSAEAKSYLARKAYSEKDWGLAKKLTEQLIHIYPSNRLLQENLKKIIAEQNR